VQGRRAEGGGAGWHSGTGAARMRASCTRGNCSSKVLRAQGQAGESHSRSGGSAYGPEAGTSAVCGWRSPAWWRAADSTPVSCGDAGVPAYTSKQRLRVAAETGEPGRSGRASRERSLARAGGTGPPGRGEGTAARRTWGSVAGAMGAGSRKVTGQGDGDGRDVATARRGTAEQRWLPRSAARR
jgi:hypothetical protein